MVNLPLISLWSQRSLVFHLAVMNIKIRFRGTSLGFLWNALEPALTFILLYTVFTSIRIRTQEDFAIYLLTGIILYHVFTRGTLAGLTSLRSNKNILESLAIKKEILPVVAVTATSLLLFIEIGVFFGLMPFFDFIPSIEIVLLPLVFILLIILILGFSYILSVINIYVKDIQPFWGIIVHAMFFVTPIIWYLDDVSGILLEIHKINPVGQIVELGHKVVIYGEIPSTEDWAYVSIFVFGIFFLGFFIFKKFESRIVEDL